MSKDLSLYMGNALVRWLAGEAMPSAPGGLFLALYDGNPKTSGIEITENIRYEGRMAMPVTAPAVGVVNELQADADVDFGAAEVESNLTHLAVFDDGGAGHILASKAIPGGPYTVVVGAEVKFDAATLKFIIGS